MEQSVEGCTLFKTFKILLLTPNDNLCCFCYEFCRTDPPPIISKKFDTLDRCTCSHQGLILF